MDENNEGLEPQNTPEAVVPEPQEVILSKQEADDLMHKAGVSSQNYERAKKAEDKVKDLEDRLKDYEVLSPPEGGELNQLRDDVSYLKKQQAKNDILLAHPVLKEVWSDFEEFQENEENKGMNMRTAAKAFLIEKGLAEKQRIGLEKPTGGSKAPVNTGMTVEDVKNLRINNYKKYLDMVQKGQIKIGS